MKQKFNFNQTLKQTFKLNQTMINSLDFLKIDNNELAKLINDALQTNPFLETQGFYNKEDDKFLESISSPSSLLVDLYKQLLTISLSYDEHIMSFLINSLNDKGFLSYNESEYLETLKISKKNFYYHLDILQSLEPTGVGAFDIIDSICIQLKALNKNKTYHLLKKYKNTILTYNYQKIQEITQLNKTEINQIFDDIKLCNPYPCSEYNFESDVYISPDIKIYIEDQQILIQPVNQPNVVVNNDLYNAVKDNDKMKEYFKDASFIVENLTKRNQTLLMITNELVKIQQGYFLYNDELQPCTLSDLANICGYHESTISRTLNQKYYTFNNEVYPLKNLLVSKTNSGDSSDAIKKAILDIIHHENKSTPLSDESITKQLERQDLFCSRRVISKYRKQLNIPSSSKRKRKA